ncbi:MAG: hypothetical protein EBU06_06415 [Micrococcales bacterium]|nr:hypothetical protein [Micrococcales bacterium]
MVLDHPKIDHRLIFYGGIVQVRYPYPELQPVPDQIHELMESALLRYPVWKGYKISILPLYIGFIGLWGYDPSFPKISVFSQFWIVFEAF